MEMLETYGMISALAIFFTQVIKNFIGKYSWSAPFLPIIPIVLCFVLTFIPGIGEPMTWLGRIVVSAGAGGFSAVAFKTGKETRKAVKTFRGK